MIKDDLAYPGDDGSEVFSSAKCRRVVCAKTRELAEFVSCKNGEFDTPLPPCGEKEIKQTGLEGKDENNSNSIGRLSTSGPSGSAHITQIGCPYLL